MISMCTVSSGDWFMKARKNSKMKTTMLQFMLEAP